MDQEVDGPEGVPDRLEGGVHRGVVGDVHGGVDPDPDAVAQRPHTLLVGFDIAKGDFGALGGQPRGDAPGDGLVIGHAHDEALLAPHQLALGQIVTGLGHGGGSLCVGEGRFVKLRAAHGKSAISR